MSKICPNCGTENLDTAKFCKQDAWPLRGDSATRCPNGHVIAPGQTKCPICEAEKQKGKTLVEDSSAPAEMFPGPGSMAQPSGGGDRSKTEVLPSAGVGVRPSAPGQGGAGRSATMVLRPSAQSAPGGEAASDRKIVGVLVTFSTRPDGQIFPVREGRNRIGRNAENEISIPDDTAMSGLNSYIIYHPQSSKQFMIDDANSQNGTFVNGSFVDERARLQNYSELRAGSTVFTFIAIKPGSNSETKPRPGADDSMKEN